MSTDEIRINHPVAKKMMFLDVETPNRDSNSICEISLFYFENGSLKAQFSTRINPRAHFSKLNMKLHHITPQDVWDKPLFKNFYKKIAPYLQSDVVICGHNSCCDLSIMRKDLARTKQVLPAHYYLDTQELAFKHFYKGEAPKGGMVLENLCTNMGIEIEAHQSKSDALATIHVYNKLIEMEEEPEKLIHDSNKTRSRMKNVRRVKVKKSTR